MDPQMLPPHFQGHSQFPPHMRDHTPSASPPIPNGAFAPHGPRGHTPQPGMGSRPSSRNGVRRMGPNNMGPQQHPGPQGPPQQLQVNNYAYMPQPAIFNPQQPPMPPHSMPQAMPVHAQYPYPPPQAHTHQMQRQMQSYADEQHRRSSLPPSLPPHPQAPPPPRHSVSPPQPQQHPIPPPVHHIHPPTPPLPQVSTMRSPPQAQHPLGPPHLPDHSAPHHSLPIVQEPQPPASVQPKMESRPVEPRRQSLLLDTSVGNLSRARGSIFTPIEDNRSILYQHLTAFQPEHNQMSNGNRTQSMEAPKLGPRSSPPQPLSPKREEDPKNTFRRPQSTQPSQGDSHRESGQRNGSLDTSIPPPPRSDSLRSLSGSVARPRLKVQIPDEASDGGSATNESASPRGTVSTGVTSQRSIVQVLPPPSPSGTSVGMLSAGASGPPNPFARPAPPHNNSMNIDTPMSALPSRFLNGEFLPSPSAFYPDWNFSRGSDGNTNASPINYATPVVGTGPSFLRDDPTPLKRKSPESGAGSGHGEGDAGGEAKRVRLES